jgi:selenoprotein W-related protein
VGLTQKLLVEFKRSIARLRLIPSDGGRFEVSVDGALVFSKLAERRFPDYEEVATAMRDKVPQSSERTTPPK